MDLFDLVFVLIVVIRLQVCQGCKCFKSEEVRVEEYAEVHFLQVSEVGIA